MHPGQLLVRNHDRLFPEIPQSRLAARLARANHRRVNDILRQVGELHGRVADLHAHFLGGDASWYTQVIEPSLVGASEVRRVFLSLL